MKEKEPVSIKSNGILNSLEKQLALARRLEKVYQNRPNPRDFIGAMAGTKSAGEYTREKIEEDEKYVNDTKAVIEKSNKEKGLEIFSMLESGFSLSEMMQAMIVDRINKGMFPNFKAIMTSERDDLRVGIDAVLKREEGKYLGAAFDFTVSSKESDIENKLQKSWLFEIKGHSIPIVKYFKDLDTGFKGSLMVPKFIIGGSKKEIEFFTEKYLEGKENELNEHPFKYLMVKQIEEQLKAALLFFEKNNNKKEYDFIHSQYKKIDLFIKELKKDINYNEYIKSKEFFEYKKQNIAYNSMKRFYFEKNNLF